MKTVDYIALVFVIIGCLNWGLIGFFNLDLVRMIFGDMTAFSRIIYGIIGISGIYAISYFGRLASQD